MSVQLKAVPPKKTRKRKSILLPKKKSKKVMKGDEYDRTFYVVERVIDSKLEGVKLFYNVKWEGWPMSENTFEPDTRLNCDRIQIEHILNCIEPTNYARTLPDILSDFMENRHVPFVEVLDPLATIALTTVHAGTVKFVQNDSVTAKTRYFKYLCNHGQKYLLHSLNMPNPKLCEFDIKKYNDQLNDRFLSFTDHPIVEVVFPDQHESVFYRPPPLYNLLFEPVTEEMVKNQSEYRALFPPKASERGFNQSRLYIRADFFGQTENNQDPRMFTLGKENRDLIQRMDRFEFDESPRFFTNLKMRQEVARGWILSAVNDVEPNTPLMMMTGVIRPNTVAHECLREDGEIVAFSSFIKIPGTGKCLDRRQFHDFSKFIPHSCSPTCSVRLVASGNDVPDLVVYTLVPLNGFNARAITIDYYKEFADDVREFFDGLGEPEVSPYELWEKEIDFVQCRCGSQQCRQVLYIDKSLKREDKTATKKVKLYNLDPEFEFHGLHIAEPPKVWNVRQYEFEN